MTFSTVVSVIAVILCAVIYILIQRIKDLKERQKELEISYQQASRNISYLVKHSEEIRQIMAEEHSALNKINEAKSDEEIYEIINSYVVANNSGL